MRIEKMKACFGRLEDETLSLQPGLNILQIPNEGGKSTWSEFLLAMLYGVETRAREKGGELPVKTKYLPWSGRPMSGEIELEQDGKRILLSRGSKKSPMGKLIALDLDSGAPLPGLDGQALIGAERSVYERSGFLRQQQLAVTPDGALEQRLGSLISAGSEDYSYLSVSRELRNLQNSIRYQKRGRLPQLEAELAAVEEQLSRVRAAQEDLSELAARQQEALARKEELEGQLSQTRQAALAQAQAQLAEAEDDLRQWERICGDNPDEAQLARLEQELHSLNEQAQRSVGQRLQQPPQPPEDERFRGLSAPQVREQAAKDEALLKSLAPKRSVTLLTALLALLGLGALLMGVLTKKPLWFAGSVLLPAALGLLLWQLARSRKAKRLLAQYGTDQIAKLGEDYASALEDYLAGKQQAEAQLNAQLRAAKELQERQKAFLAQLREYLPDCDGLTKAAVYLSEAKQALQERKQAQRELQVKQERVQLLQTQGYVPNSPQTEALARCERELQELRSSADRQRGALQSIGDALALEAQRAQLSERIAELSRSFDALVLAQETLAQADEDLRAEFSPMLCEKTSALFHDLTQGRYDRVLLDRSFAVTVRETGSLTPRPLTYLSGGAQQQLYLALRLAICALLLPDAPLILDDALAFFDDERAAITLKVLQQEAEHRQILLFTCHSREKALI